MMIIIILPLSISDDDHYDDALLMKLVMMWKWYSIDD